MSKVYLVGTPPQHAWICDECQPEHNLGLVCRGYFRIQRARSSFQGTLRHLRSGTIYYKIVETAFNDFYTKEEEYLEALKPIIEQSVIWDWCKKTSGLGHVAALTFLSYIRTHIHMPICPSCGKDLPLLRVIEVTTCKCGKNVKYKEASTRRIEVNTAGKSRKYFGLYPGARLTAGRKGGFSPMAKGRVLGVVVPGILKARRGVGDSYYRALYDAKRYFYANHSQYKDAVKLKPIKGKLKFVTDNPKTCPKYDQCKAKLKRRKEPACAGHLQQMVRRWMGGILVSHATQLIRQGKGLDITNFYAHRAYISPKSYIDEVPDTKVLEQIRTGEAGKSWK